MTGPHTSTDRDSRQPPPHRTQITQAAATLVHAAVLLLTRLAYAIWAHIPHTPAWHARRNQQWHTTTHTAFDGLNADDLLGHHPHSSRQRLRPGDHLRRHITQAKLHSLQQPDPSTLHIRLAGQTHDEVINIHGVTAATYVARHHITYTGADPEQLQTLARNLQHTDTVELTLTGHQTINDFRSEQLECTTIS